MATTANEASHRQEGVLGFLDFPHDLTAQSRDSVHRAFSVLSRSPIRALCLNFEYTSYINSSGIEVLVALVEQALAAGVAVFAYGVSREFRGLFGMVSLTEHMAIVADEREARLRAAATVR
jgi:anti-anti-sigma regulatory factor